MNTLNWLSFNAGQPSGNWIFHDIACNFPKDVENLLAWVLFEYGPHYHVKEFDFQMNQILSLIGFLSAICWWKKALVVYLAKH